MGNQESDIKIMVKRKQVVIYTTTIFTETGTVQCQGIGFINWAKNTFPSIKSIMLMSDFYKSEKTVSLKVGVIQIK